MMTFQHKLGLVLAALGAVALPLGCSAAAPDGLTQEARQELAAAPTAAPAPVAADAGVGGAWPVKNCDDSDDRPDPAVCTPGCKSAAVGSNERNACCQACYCGVDYDPGVMVCSTESVGIMACEGDTTGGIHLGCRFNTVGVCPSGYSVDPDGNVAPGDYCFTLKHTWTVACNDCNGNGTCDNGDDFGGTGNTCPNGTTLCNSSGGTDDQSHYEPCSVLDNGGVTCCHPTNQGSNTDTATPYATVAAADACVCAAPAATPVTATAQ